MTSLNTLSEFLTYRATLVRRIDEARAAYGALTADPAATDANLDAADRTVRQAEEGAAR